MNLQALKSLFKGAKSRQPPPVPFTGVGTVFLSDIFPLNVTAGLDTVNLVREMNEAFAMTCDYAMGADGSVVNFVGDAVLAVWGPTFVTPSHAELALNCSRKIIERQQKLITQGATSFSFRILLATGEMTVTFVGGRLQVYGKPMAVVKRMDEMKITKRNQVLCTSETLALIPGNLSGQRVGTVKGTSASEVDVFEFVSV